VICHLREEWYQVSITLAEVLPLLERKRAYLEQLVQERISSSTIKYELGDTEEFIDRPERNPDEITEEIEFVSKQIRKLQRELTKANVNIVTDFVLDGENLTLGELVIALDQMRRELPRLQSLANYRSSKKKRNQTIYVDGKPVVQEKVDCVDLTFEPSLYRKKAESLQRQIDKAQAILNKFNVETVVDFSDEVFSPKGQDKNAKNTA
jgi:anion-transporting  ArsA/GET3 family ATPase